MGKYRIGIMIFIIVVAGANLLRPKTGFDKRIKCSQDMDCYPMQEVCGEGMCVNQRYLPEAQAAADKVDPSACRAGVKPQEISCACVQKRCQPQPPVAQE